MNTNNIRLEQRKADPEWHFKNVRSVERFTHGYHRYPAKFLPNLVKKLIEKYTKPNDTIADVFAGCGTTLVEAKVHGRKSIGVDINPVAELITKVKTNPIEPAILKEQFDKLVKQMDLFNINDSHNRTKTHERLDYWFKHKNKNKIAFLKQKISNIRKKPEIKAFFQVSLSHILKNSSRWLQSSTKPQIDPNKSTIDPFKAFNSHTELMMKKNAEFYVHLEKKGFLDTECEIKLGDAKDTKIKSNSIATIITSPPYVTSYEYADIHQLTAYLFNYTKDIANLRKKFIGTLFSLNQNLKCNSTRAQRIVNKLSKKDNRIAKEVANYFNDMQSVIKEMYRILRDDGRVCVVIGNTTFHDVKIKSTEVFVDLLTLHEFKIVNIIKRSIPHKLIPTIRDKKTGKFARMDSDNNKLVYPDEYIIVAKKNKTRKARGNYGHN